MSILPQELLDAILDRVNDEDALKQCSLAAKSLLIPSQRVLFRSLYLYTSDNTTWQHPSSTCEHAQALFVTSPHLAKYIRTLTLCLVRNPTEDFAQAEYVLAKAVLVSRLAIHGSVDNFRWDSMSPAFISALLEAVQRPTVQCFHLKRIIGVPSSLMFYAASTFRVFSVERIEILQADEDSVLLRQPPPNRLEELLLPAAFRSEAACTFLLDLNARGALQHLRRVAWRIYGHANPHWESWLHQARLLPSLSRVELWFTLQFPRIDLPAFPHMRTLELKCRMDSAALPASIQGIIARLPATAPRLCVLVLSLRVAGRRNGLHRWSSDVAPLAPFGSADYARQLPALCRVHCCLKDSARELHQGFAPYMACKFPGAQAEGALLCETFEVAEGARP
ncbi:hypothetical protein B0H15DRAFT_954149 [Mycena belliarum]|uniref:F-box domain-containing protein n=1 Tax=Mycena belliarum TaxID=1033014 RepID=A0AAD6TTT4_9AGAR|nr:hypothetical protein B0H15DRAFT_954149 [Mycena belliae]